MGFGVTAERPTITNNNMKALNLELVLEGITAKKDKSLSLRFSTPELSSSEKSIVMDLQGVVLDSLLQPKDIEFPEIVEVKTETEQKTASSRLRGSLWILHQKSKSDLDFDVYYRQQMEKFIDRIKEKIAEYEN